jgi:hypothetical protein
MALLANRIGDFHHCWLRIGDPPVWQIPKTTPTASPKLLSATPLWNAAPSIGVFREANAMFGMLHLQLGFLGKPMLYRSQHSRNPTLIYF